jgi:hypothetical protein
VKVKPGWLDVTVSVPPASDCQPVLRTSTLTVPLSSRSMYPSLSQVASSAAAKAVVDRSHRSESSTHRHWWSNRAARRGKNAETPLGEPGGTDLEIVDVVRSDRAGWHRGLRP